MIATSDHETGGLSLGAQIKIEDPPVYAYYPEKLDLSTNSAQYLTQLILSYDGDDLVGYVVDEILISRLNVEPDDPAVASLLVELMAASTPMEILRAITRFVNKRALLGFTTEGHTAVDVNIYGYASNPYLLDKLRGNHENTDINKFISNYLDLDLDKITNQLNN